VLAVCSVIVSLYLFELLLFFYVQSGYKLYVQLRYDFDIRDRTEVVAELGERNITAYPLVSALSYWGKGIEKERIWPLGALSTSKTVLGNENGAHTIYDSDEYGFRNPQGMYQQSVDIALIGDSFTHGCCVEDSETISGHLGKRNFTTLNMGLAGIGPLSEYAILQEYLSPLKPRSIAWIFYAGNDLVDLKVESASAHLMSYMEQGYIQGLVDRQNEVDRILLDYYTSFLNRSVRESPLQVMWDSFQSSSFIKLRGIRHPLGLLRRPREERATDLYAQEIIMLCDIMAKASSSAAEWGGKLYFFCLPAYEETMTGGKPAHIGKMLSMLADNGVPVMDGYDIFGRTPDLRALYPKPNLYHPKWGMSKANHHLNDKGYGVVARAIAERISADIQISDR
jgi:hypothetical protein